jgi:hypothetical protein
VLLSGILDLAPLSNQFICAKCKKYSPTNKLKMTEIPLEDIVNAASRYSTYSVTEAESPNLFDKSVLDLYRHLVEHTAADK